MAIIDNKGNHHFNQGHKDQQLALKWVQENIENFGGDKNNVSYILFLIFIVSN